MSYQATQSGLINLHTGAVLNYFSRFKLDGTTLYSQGGGVADVSGTSIVQKGVFPGLANLGIYGTGIKDFAAADLAAPGTASISAINPGAPVSSAINFSIQ